MQEHRQVPQQVLALHVFIHVRRHDLAVDQHRLVAALDANHADRRVGALVVIEDVGVGEGGLHLLGRVERRALVVAVDRHEILVPQARAGGKDHRHGEDRDRSDQAGAADCGSRGCRADDGRGQCHVQGRQRDQRAFDAPHPDQEEARCERPEDGAYGIPGEHLAHGAGRPPARRRMDGACQRERHTHEERRQDHVREGCRETGRLPRRELAPARPDQRAGQPGRVAGEVAQQPGDAEGRAADQGLHRREQSHETLRAAAGRAASHEQAERLAAQADARQERREHHGERIGGRAQRRAEGACPQYLVAEGAEAADADARQHELRTGSRHDRGVLRLILRCAVRHRRRPAPPEQQCCHGDRDVHEHGDKERARGAQSRQEQEAGHDGADHRAQRVESVEERQVPGQAAARPARITRQYRQRGAHQRGRHDHRDGGQEEAERGEGGGVVPERAGQGHIDGRVHLQHAVGGKGRQGNAQFEQAVGAQRPPPAIGTATDEPTSEGQPAHEDREHRRDRKVGAAEDEALLADPHHLVDERGGAREQEQQVEGRAHRGPPAAGDVGGGRGNSR
jgi:hypothetical protein